MALIDSLLRIMSARGAECLTLATGRVPSLRRRGEEEALSMPPLADAMIEGLLGDVLSDESRARFADEPRLESVYASENAGRFTVSVRRDGAAIELVFRPAGGAARAAPAASASAAAPAVAPAPAAAAAPARAQACSAGPEALHRFLRRAEHEGASDVILTTGRASRMRLGGDLVELDELVCSEQDLLELVGDALGPRGREQLERTGSADVALDHRDRGGVRYRVNLFRQHLGLAAALRPIRVGAPTASELSLPEDLLRLVDAPHGIVLVTGPAGSGKSTTVVALTEHINRTRDRHIVTLEDPIEYEYVSRRSLVHQRELGADLDSFAGGLRAALRESPDVIVLGEMRDLETISAALTAAEAGHLVLSTLHSNRAVDAVDRMIDVFPAAQQRQVRVQLASVLRAVVTQFLLPTRSPGLRLPAVERLVVNRAIAAMIREDRCHQIESQLQTGRDEGMMPLDRDLARLVRAGHVELEIAERVTLDPAALRALVGR